MRALLITFGLAIGVLGFTSCEKEVNFNLPNSISEKLVVEGSIEIGSPPMVLLTQSFGFFSNLDLNNLQDAFRSGAIITVSEGSNSVQLREYSIDTAGSKYVFYSVDIDNPNDLNFLGQAGKTYNLKIELEGKMYESVTTIPQPVPFDSIWSEPFENPREENPEFRRVMVKYTDPPALGNRYRVYIKQNNRPYLSPRYSTFNDDLINGTTSDLDYYNVITPMDTTTDDSRYAFLPGDTVRLKFSAIDAETYDFWSTLDFSVGTTGNPFATPIKVPTNITGGALGIWGGYAPTIKTVIIKE